jgi:hypothetical protein
MKNWWRKLAVLLLFAALPFQGTAATLAALSCVSGDEPQTVQSHAHSHHESPSHQHDGGAANDHSQHLCCHLFASSLPAAVVSTPAADLPAFESSISLLATLFIPEQPQRPPRS